MRNQFEVWRMAKYFKANTVFSSGEYWDFGAIPSQEH